MPAQPGNPVITDGSLSFAGGVDSLAATTVQSQNNPGGLPRDMLAWLVNATVRDDGISQRWGWQPVMKLVDTAAQVLSGSVGYQGGYMYEPDIGNPYLVFAVGGHIYKADVESGAVTDLSQQFNQFHPSSSPIFHFCQGEQFLIIQAGDYLTAKPPTLPLFWDGTILRRSIGIPVPPPPPACVANPAGTITLTNIANNQAGQIYPAAPAQQVLSGPGWSIHGPIPAFTMPAVGQAITLTTGGITGNFPQNFNAFIPGGTSGTGGTVQFAQCAPGTGGTGPSSAAAPPPAPEIPAAGPMDYYMGRLWYGQGRTYSAGDIVNGPSGTAAYQFRDSILKLTENPLVIGGDGFTLPTNAGNIRAIAHSSNINASLGQGQLYIFTRKAVYALQVPVTRNDWIATNNSNGPLQTVVQLVNGAVSDRSVVPVNGDLFYQSLEPAIRSLITAVRYFQQWGNVSISANIQRVLQNNDRALLQYSSGIVWDNRLLMTQLPRQTLRGVVHSALAPLDFIPVSKFGANLNPVWEGTYNGLDIFQLFTGDFGGLQRAFALVLSSVDGGIWLWELGQEGILFENGSNRVVWQIEFPAFTFGDEYELKKLVGAELWVDRVMGTVEFAMEYREDGESCWRPWHKWKICSAKDCTETIPASCLPPQYPPVAPPPLGSGYRNTMSLPKPPIACGQQMGRPSDVGHQFQTRLTVKGYCRVRGLYLHGTDFQRKLYENIQC